MRSIMFQKHLKIALGDAVSGYFYVIRTRTNRTSRNFISSFVAENK